MNTLITPAGMTMAPGASLDGKADGGDAGLFDFHTLARIFAERKWLLLGVTALGLAAGIIASLLITPLYRSTATIELNPPQVEVFGGRGEEGANQNTRSVGTAEFVQTQLGLLRSDALALRVAQQLNLAANPAVAPETLSRAQRNEAAAKYVKDALRIESVRESMLISVGAVSPDNQLAARIANATAESFITTTLERRYDSSSYARNFLQTQLATTKDALEQSERRLNDYAIRSGIIRTGGRTTSGTAPSESDTISVSNLTQLNQALNEARIRRINAEQAYRSGAVGQAQVPNAAAEGLRQQRALLQAQYQEKSRTFLPDYPEMRELRTRIDSLDAAIARESSTAGSSTRERLRAEYEAASRAEQALAQRVNGLRSEVQSERGRSIELNILQREVDTNRDLYDALLQRYKEIGVAGGIGQSNVSLVDRAEVARAPFRPNLGLNIALGLLGGLLVGAALVLFLHLLFDNVTTPDDVREKVGLPLIGVVPAETEGLTLAEALEDPKSHISEAYFSARTGLQYAGADGPPRSLLLTSTRPGEGKSTSSFAIARNFAKGGSRVLLIDADMRKPTFQSGDRESRGLGHLLQSSDPLLNFVQPTQTDNLQLLPVGRFTGSPAELLASVRLKSLIQEAAREFDMVVIDGPPVLGLADAPLLGALTEATLLVIESGETRTGAVKEMLRRLRASGTNVLGALLTKYNQGRSSYGYYNYSYRYGGEDVGGRVSSDRTRTLDIVRD